MLHFAKRDWKDTDGEFGIAIRSGLENPDYRLVGTLSVVVIFSITTIVGTFLSRRLWDINFMLGPVNSHLTVARWYDTIFVWRKLNRKKSSVDFHCLVMSILLNRFLT